MERHANSSWLNPFIPCFPLENFIVLEKKYAPVADKKDSKTISITTDVLKSSTLATANPVAIDGTKATTGAKRGCHVNFFKSLNVHRIATTAIIEAIYLMLDPIDDGII